MSGGSYDYLYCKEPEEIFANAAYIEDMAETLIKLGHLDVARDMTRLSEYIRSAYNRIDVLSQQLKPIMKAVEYYEDCDMSAETLGEEVEKYRSGTHIGGTFCWNCGADMRGGKT